MTAGVEASHRAASRYISVCIFHTSFAFLVRRRIRLPAKDGSGSTRERERGEWNGMRRRDIGRRCIRFREMQRRCIKVRASLARDTIEFSPASDTSEKIRADPSPMFPEKIGASFIARQTCTTKALVDRSIRAEYHHVNSPTVAAKDESTSALLADVSQNLNLHHRYVLVALDYFFPLVVP